MAHSHDSRVPESDAERDLSRRLTLFIVVPIAVLAVIGVILLWPGEFEIDVEDPSAGFIDDELLVEADVESVDRETCDFEIDPSLSTDCDVVTATLRTGDDAGDEIEFSIPQTASSPEIAAGDRVQLLENEGAPLAQQYTYFDHVRRAPVFVLAVIFAIAVIVFGRWKGVGALVGLAFTLVVVIAFVVPAILDGKNAVVVAIVASALMMIVTLYLAHGVRLQTVVAILGTLAALVLTVLLSWLWVSISTITGLATEEAILVQIGASAVDLTDLVLAGIIIGSLGVLDDVTVTQAAAVRELRAADPAMGVRTLVTRGISIGRDHVASTVNTLVLAYVGAALPLFLLFQVGNAAITRVINGELVVVEIIRALVGSLGIIAAVPITTALAAWLMAGTMQPESSHSSTTSSSTSNESPDVQP